MICERTISQSFYRSWVYKYEQAKTAINHKQLKILNVVSEIERDFNLLGATAIEDQLQDKAAETISAIKQAGIKFWMLTGDKLETAVNIGFACKVLDQGTQIFRIEQQSKQDIMNYLTMVLKNIQKSDRNRKRALKEGAPFPEYATILSGESFFKIQSSERLLDCFMELVLTSRVLIACRMSPAQKADIIRLIKEY
jgi:magnesium-transporting ATPase (P-type)